MDETPYLESAWLRLLCSFGVSDTEARQAFETLATAYREPGRFYHNLDHIRAVLETIEFAERARDLSAVQLAAWFHDAVYDSRAADNEERSAALAESRCIGWGVPRGTIDTVVRLILATKTHEAAADDIDCHLLLDADLAILGAEQDQYARYADAIRREYAWVPEEDYRRGRARVLQSFLEREHIFRLPPMREHFTAAARRNLREELTALGV